MAAALSIPQSHVIANELLFDPGTGAYAGFNSDQPTSRSGGKLAVAQQLRAAGHAPLVMVGDGATDLEARAADGSGADCFIGFGGTRVRAGSRHWPSLRPPRHVALHSIGSHGLGFLYFSPSPGGCVL